MDDHQMQALNIAFECYLCGSVFIGEAYPQKGGAQELGSFFDK